ncbi:MAG: AAA family ATPase [Pseudomonadota bacterium]
MKNDVTAEMLKRLNEELQALAARRSVPPALAALPTPPAFEPPIVGTRQPVPEIPSEIRKLRSALEVLSPDALRGQGKLYEPGDKGTSANYWLVVIWGVASLGWSTGKDIVREWSQQSTRYTEEGFEAAWNEYDPRHPHSVGIASLYKLAIDRGWKRPIDLYEPVAANSSHYKILSPSDLYALPPLQWRVKGILPATGIAAMYGPSSSGKSFLALDLAAAIVRGVPWFGSKTYQSAVVYVMLEGEGGIRNRIGALEAAKGTLPAQFGVVAQPFQITTPQDVDGLATVIPKRAVVFIDTLNRAAPTSDENSSKDMGAILQAAKHLQAFIGGLVIVVHHTGKDPSKGMRGHSSLHAALDGAIEVERSATGARHWSVAKTKDGEDGKQVAFKLKVHVLGQDGDGDDITSCSVEADHSAIFMKPAPNGKRQKSALKAVKSALAGPQADTGKAGCPAGTACLKVEDAVNTVASTLTTTASNKRTNAARQVLQSLMDGGFLRLKPDADGEAWCWLE